jgi:hypothetical protein
VLHGFVGCAGFLVLLCVEGHGDPGESCAHEPAEPLLCHNEKRGELVISVVGRVAVTYHGEDGVRRVGDGSLLLFSSLVQRQRGGWVNCDTP